MSVNVEKLENNLAKLTIEIPVEEIEAAKNEVFKEQKNRISIPGFRKGKVTRQVVERMYGKAVFFEDAVNKCIEPAYVKAADESGLEIVSKPDLEFTTVELGQPVVFVATVATMPAVTLGDYKGLEVEAEVVEVTEEDVDAALAEAQKKNATKVTVEDRAVEMGDSIKLDFDGSVNGVPFDGGKAEDFDLVIGSGSFIPGFEDQLVGAEIGKELVVAVTFPETYHAEELAGKAAEFKCTVKSISAEVLPELNDEFASEVSEFETLDEYKASLRAGLVEKKEADARAAKEDALVEKAVENAEMVIPQLMIDTEAETMVNEFAQRLQMQGLSMEQYTQYTGQTVEQMTEQNKEQAEKRIRTRLVLEEIVKIENIEATDEDVDAEVAKMAEQYGMEAEQVKSYLGEKEIADMKSNLAVQKAVDFLYDNAK